MPTLPFWATTKVEAPTAKRFPEAGTLEIPTDPAVRLLVIAAELALIFPVALMFPVTLTFPVTL